MSQVPGPLENVNESYFDFHPDFAPMGSNDLKLNHLVATHLRGENAHELSRLIEAIAQDPLHQQFMAEQAGASPLARASSVSRSSTPPLRLQLAGPGLTSRSRSRSRGRAQPKAKKRPKAKPQTNSMVEAKAMPKAAISSSSRSGESSSSKSEVLDDADDCD